jgi:hypothetical protein
MRDAFGTFALDYQSDRAPPGNYLIPLVGKPEMETITERVVEYFAQGATVTGNAANKEKSRMALGRLVRDLIKKDLAKLERTPRDEIKVNTAMSNLEKMLWK